MAKQIKITLVKGLAGTLPVQRRTIKALGLGKINRVHELPDNESVRGMIFKVKHLVEIVEE